MTIGEDVFHVRSLTIGELRRLDEVSNWISATGVKTDLRTGLFYGLALCADVEGSPAIPKEESETDAAFAERVTNELADVPTEVLRALGDAVSKIGTTPKPETVAKN